MYPQRELKTLALNKARLRRRLARRRDECREAAVELLKPVAWFDRARARWRQVSPLVKLAGLVAGLFAGRPIFAGARRAGTWLRWGAAAFSLFRGLKAMRS